MGAFDCIGPEYKKSPDMHEGFVLRRSTLDLPLSNEALAPEFQQDLLICHLFVNKRRTVSQIMLCFELQLRDVIECLLRHGVISDRRQARPAA
jgi:hypothetical protein